jgi:DNA-binding GntR family transcriptional regulator
MQNKIHKNTLKDRVVHLIMSRIINGDILVGDKLREVHLAKELGISQAPVREAIIYLTSFGILEHKANIGASVKAHNDDEIIEIYQARDALESYAVTHIKDFKDLKKMKKAYIDMLNAIKDGDIKSFVIYDQCFHETLVGMCNNQLILELWRQQYAKSSVINIVKGFESSFDDIVSLHLPIVEAIEAKSSLVCVDAVEKHYETIIKTIKDK